MDTQLMTVPGTLLPKPIDKANGRQLQRQRS